MPLLFSYGTLQQEDVQLAAFGRPLAGWSDELVGFAPSLVRIDDPEVVVRLGTTHHANVEFDGNDSNRVPGTVFEITDAELASADEYEAEFHYGRITAVLSSGREAWLYVNTSTRSPVQ